MRRAVVGLAVVLLWTSSGGLPSSAAPVNWYFETSNPCALYSKPCLLDSSTLKWGHQLGPKMFTAVYDTLYSSYDTTEINVTYIAGGHSVDDDIFYKNDDDGDFNDYLEVARYGCLEKATSHECAHAHINFDNETLAELFFAEHPSRLKSVACHETGHGVGLRHGEDGDPDLPPDSGTLLCLAHPTSLGNMFTTFPFNSNLGNHNVVHVDAHY